MKSNLEILTVVILIIIDLKILTTQYSRKLTIRVDKIKNLGSRYSNGICIKPNENDSSICEAVFLCVGYKLWNNKGQINFPKWFLRTLNATDESSFNEPENYIEALIPTDQNSVTLYLLECNKELFSNIILKFLSFWSLFSANLNCIPCKSDNNFGELYGNIQIKNQYKALTFRSISFIVENISMKNMFDLFYESCTRTKCSYNSTNVRFYVNNVQEYEIYSNNINLNNLINTVIFFSNNFSFWFGDNGIKIKITMARYEDWNNIFESIEISVAKIASLLHSLIVEQNIEFQKDPIKITIQTFSTNYVGDNLEYICKFHNKDTVCGKDGNTDCVRKYNKNFGVDCKVIDPCLTNKCQNSATCKKISMFYECVCAYGSSGKYCEKLYCNKNCDICQINKTCHICKSGWEGKDCSLKSCTHFYCGFGKCQLINNTRSCLCLKGRFGEKCNDTCSSGCKNGVCDFYNGYSYCKCNTGYIGINCNIKDSKTQINYSKSDTFIYTLASITIIITFIIVIIFILLLRFNPNRESDDQDLSTYFVTQAGIKQTEMINEGESNSVKKNVKELPDFIYEFNISEKLKERVKKQELSGQNSEKNSSKEEKILTITDASKNISYETKY